MRGMRAFRQPIEYYIESMPEPRHARIVVVEDEALVAMLIEDSLTAAGHEIIGIADTVADAVALVEADRPDLVLCDIMLLDGDSGLDVATFLAARGIACLFVCGQPPSAEVARGIAIGCFLKPFRPAPLNEAVQAALELAGGHQPEKLPDGMTLYC